MLLLTSNASVMETILLGMKANLVDLPETNVDLKRSYQNYLQAVHGSCNWLRRDGEPILEVVTNDDRRRQLTRHFQNSSELDDNNQVNVVQNDALNVRDQIRIARAIERLSELSPLHAEFFELVIEKVFCAPAGLPIGGSTSESVGLIWTNVIEGFEEPDYVEVMVHELTHNLLFLDEWIRPHYVYKEITREDRWCRSAIRRVRRPLDKVFHAIIVAAEILLFRRYITGADAFTKIHGSSSSLEQGIRASIKELRSLPTPTEFLHPRFWELIGAVEERVLAETTIDHSSRLALA